MSKTGRERLSLPKLLISNQATMRLYNTDSLDRAGARYLSDNIKQLIHTYALPSLYTISIVPTARLVGPKNKTLNFNTLSAGQHHRIPRPAFPIFAFYSVNTNMWRQSRKKNDFCTQHLACALFTTAIKWACG